jgi:cytochrome P450
MSIPSTASSASAAYTKPPHRLLAHLPGEDGWPIIGNTLAALKDPVGRVEAMYRKYGPVYRDHLFGVRSVAMLGPEANELVLFDHDKNFSSSDGWGFLLDRLFPRGLMLMDFDEHRLHRKALGVAFKPAPMKAYLGALNNRISQRIAEWHLAGSGQGGTADLRFYPAIKQLTLDLAATSFLGIELGSQANTINSAFIDMVAATIGVVRSPIPGTQMWKGVKGRETIIAFFREQIPERRAGQATDLFSELCRATKEDGSLLTEQEIADHMSFMMMAAHDTLTSSVTSLVYMLGKHPEWQDKLRVEMHGLGLPSGAPLPYERLGELALFEMAFKEAMRINPPVPGLPRTALRDFQFKGLEIPAGTRVAINTVFTHRMPEIWPEPLKFDPLRFMDAAVRARHKYAWVPFGGGAHMCLGLHFAYMQAKSFFYHLLTTTRISLAHGYIQRWQMWPIPKPRDGLPIRIERISGQAG